MAPTIINTFLEKYDFTGKKITLFATSGGSGFGNTINELQPSAPGAEFVEGGLLNRANRQEIAAVITHVGFYAGWPKAWAVFNLAKEV